MKKLIAILLIISILGLSSCTTMLSEPASSDTSGATETSAPQEDITDIDSSLDEINDLEQELDFSELDDLEQELDELDW